MLLKFNENLVQEYKSSSQKIRVMSESWVKNNAYCVRCGKELAPFENNKPVGDFYCISCNEEFELKSKSGNYGTSIADGAYETMIKKIEDDDIPNFFYLNYCQKTLEVDNLIVIPKHYFTKDIIIKRPPLSSTSRRAGWVGCNINLNPIPTSGRLYLIKDKQVADKNIIITQFNKMLFLRGQKINLKGWLLDIMKCIESLNKNEFLLEDIYNYGPILKSKHPENNHIKDKIRQQLQILRDNNYIEFLGKGKYKLR